MLMAIDDGQANGRIDGKCKVAGAANTESAGRDTRGKEIKRTVIELLTS
jgi:hypothetical protein